MFWVNIKHPNKMKIYTRQEIEDSRRLMKENKFRKHHVNLPGIEFNYYELPQSLNPSLPSFVYRCTGNPEDGYVFGIADSVAEPFRPYAVAHEFIEFMELQNLETGRCRQALETELSLVPEEIKSQYVNMRRAFFGDLITYCKSKLEDYTEKDISEFELSLKRLKELAS